MCVVDDEKGLCEMIDDVCCWCLYEENVVCALKG